MTKLNLQHLSLLSSLKKRIAQSNQIYGKPKPNFEMSRNSHIDAKISLYMNLKLHHIYLYCYLKSKLIILIMYLLVYLTMAMNSVYMTLDYYGCITNIINYITHWGPSFLVYSIFWKHHIFWMQKKLGWNRTKPYPIICGYKT